MKKSIVVYGLLAVGVGSSQGWAQTEEEWCELLATPRALCPNDACDLAETRDAWTPTAQFTDIQVRLKFNILHNDASNAEVNQEVLDMKNHFAGSGITFTHSIERLTASPYWEATVSSVDGSSGVSGEDIKQAHADSPATQINIYVVDLDFFPNNPNLDAPRAWAVFPWDADATATLGGVIIDQVEIGRGLNPLLNSTKILTHEVGHTLGLWHSHHGTQPEELDEVYNCDASLPGLCSCACYEGAGRSTEDGDTTGDLCSDTPSRPGFPIITDCSQPNFTDPCTGEYYVGSKDTNYMSLQQDGDCRLHFTNQQDGRLNCWTCDTVSGWLTGTQGICCFDGGDCQETTSNCCDNIGGAFAAGNSCPADSTPGACCAPGGACTDLSQGCCQAIGDSWFGGLGTCATFNCPSRY